MKIFTLRYILLFALFPWFASVFGLTADFSFSLHSNCAPTIVEFVNNSSKASNISYTWDFGLGATVTTKDYSNREQIYTKTGKYTVTLTLSDGNSSVTKSATFTIAQAPKVSFITDVTSGCNPLTVTYTNTSVQGDSAISSISWDFRNGSYASGSPIEYTYTKAGKYSIILKVTDKNGCSGVTESDSLIQVVDNPVVNFKASDTAACAAPLNVSFTNQSSGTGDLTYIWDYGNDKTSTDVTNSCVYTSSGNYSVKLTATDLFGCSSSLTKEAYMKIGTATGTVSVYDANKTLVNSDNLCSGTYTFAFSVDNLPVYTWTITDNNKTTTISDTSQIQYTVTDSGTLKINLVYGNDLNCTKVIEMSFVKNYIKADFDADASIFCSLPKQLSFLNTSENSTNYSWYISGNAFSTSEDASYTVTQDDISALTYQQLYSHEADSVSIPVKLVTTNANGCVDSITRYVYLSLPVAQFMPNKVAGCTPLQVSFADSSKSVFSIDSYSYYIEGKDISATADSPLSYTFTTPGVYKVVEIISSNGCNDTSNVVQISVGTKLKPDFTVTPSEVCNGGEIHIKANSNNNDVVNSWKVSSPGVFDFTSLTTPDTSVTIKTDSIGSRNIALQINYNGCFSDTTKKDIYEISGLTGSFTETFSCDSALVYWFKSTVKPSSSIKWYIDTATYSNVDSVRFKFPKSGNYQVKLVATDNTSGCSLTRSKEIKVRQVNAEFSITDSVYCVGDTVKVNASSSVDYINDCHREGFLWTFGDDSPPRRVSSTSYSYVYTSKGSYKILLVTSAENGCVDSVKKYVYISKPEASFTVDKYTGCVPSMDINFTNTSTDTTILSSIWNFGDGSTDTSEIKKILHTYNSSTKKSYTATLTVYDAYQCYGNYSIPLTIVSVNSDFQADDNAVCAGETITFSPVDSDLDSLSWDFGDGTVSTTSYSHTYNTKGLYTVSLTAYKDSCSSITSKQEYVSVEKADAGFTVSDSVMSCYPDTVVFMHPNINGSTTTTQLWTFDSNELEDTSDTVKYIYTQTGTYTTTLYVKTLNGCEASNSKKISISGPSARYSFSPDVICYNDSVTFQMDSMNNVSEWKWLFGDGSTSSENPTFHYYTSKGKLIPAITLISGDCSVTLTMDTLSVGLATAGFYLVDSAAICYGEKISFKNTSTGSEYWTWFINNVRKYEDYDISDVVLSKTGLNTIKLVATDSNNCTDTLERSYNVLENPVFSIEGDSVLCKNQSSVTLTVTQSDGWTIKWSPTTGISSATSFTITAQPAANTTYQATVTDAYGCYSTYEKTILVNQLASYTRIPLGDTTLNIGDKISLSILTDTTDMTYAWSPNYKISCLNCSSTLVNPTKDITYTVEIKNTCVDFSEKFNIKVIFDFYLEAPAAFTPNGDSNNDVFGFEAYNIQSFELKIFNRWGQLVFSTNDINNGWDGTVSGHLQNADTYTYFVKAETTTGYKFEKTGNFLLLK